MLQEKKTIKINEDQLREVLTNEERNAHRFDWTGWRIPIFVEDDGSVSSGSWLSYNSWQPDVIELPVKVETWSMTDIHNDYRDEDGNDMFDEYDLEAEIEQRVDWKIKQLKEDYDEDTEFELI